MNDLTLYLGVHRPTWLTIDGPPLMVSLRTLPKHKGYRSAVPWFVDSGGFTELQMHGRWRTTAEQHAERCMDVMERFGNVAWLSPQDWMCEPAVINGGTFKDITFVGTGLSVREHQERTVDNYLELIDISEDMPWVPVLQGWTVEDYHRHVDMYLACGVDLRDNHLVGVGSVCRRESMPEAIDIMRTLHARGLLLHGFGFKQEGIAACWPYLESADSMAWSYNAKEEGRKYGRSCGRPNGRGGAVKSCANCRHYALAWYERTINRVEPQQMTMEFAS